MPLFEIAILEIPTKKEVEENSATEKLVFGPAFVIAKDAQSAAIKAVLENAEAAGKVDKEKMQVLVRSFGVGEAVEKPEGSLAKYAQVPTFIPERYITLPSQSRPDWR